MYDLLIKNADIHTGEQALHGDIAVRGGKIAAVAPRIDAAALETADAGGLLIIPGGVDAHTHFGLLSGENRTADGYAAGSAAALAGGTTCFIEHISFGPPGSLPSALVTAAARQAAGESLIDYSLHGVVQSADVDSLLDVASLPRQGVTSLKAYMTYDYALNASALAPVLKTCRELGLLLCVHAEDDHILGLERQRLLAAGNLQPAWHGKSRPRICEALAISNLLRAARQADDAPIYIVHVSTADGLAVIRDARQREQQNIYVETCPQYLLRDESMYQGELALNAVMSPPLRSAADCEALWKALAAGEIDVVATDHCAFSPAQKRQGQHNFLLCPNGAPGAGERMLLMFAAGVRARRISLQRMLEVCCLNPARLFGLTQKGRIAPGADADLLLLDPEQETLLGANGVYGKAGSSIYQGLRLPAGVHSVYTRGQLALRQGMPLAARGSGRFLRRAVSAAYDE